MGRRGPAPKPTALRLIDGDKESRINHHEPVPRSGGLECPDDATQTVRAIWDFTVDELEHMGIDSPCDRDSLYAFCCAVANHREASRIIGGSSLLMKSPKHGAWVRNPMLIVQHQAAREIRAFAQEFGLTPSARSRIAGQGDTEDHDNPFADTAP